MWSFVTLLFSFYLKNLECVRVLELTFRSQPNEQCANGTSVREEQSLLPAFTLCTLTLLQLAGYVGRGGRHRSHETQGDRCWPSGITEMVRGPQGNMPWTPYPSSVENLKDGNSLFFLCCFFEGGGIVYVCFPAHVTSDKIGPLVQSLKLCQKANSSPPWGLALNLPGLYMFCGTHKEAIGDSLRVSLKPASHAEKSWCFPLGLHAFLFICEPFPFCF